MLENWNRKTWRLAGPVIVSNVSVPLLGAVDMAVVGHLPGPQYLGAVAVAALIFNIVYHGCNFLRMGTTGLTAQALGRGDTNEVAAWLHRSGLLAALIGIALIALQVPILWLSLMIVGPGEAVADLAATYFNIRIWGAPAALFNFALLGWLFGIQNTRAALATQIFMNGLNITLDLWFVLGLGWGVEGVAWATLISEVGSIGLGLYLARRNLIRIRGVNAPADGKAWARAKDTTALKRMVGVGGDIFVRSLCLQASFVAFTALAARMGDSILAANAVLLNFQLFMSYALDGFANAAEALTGEALGAGNRHRFRQAVKATARWAAVFAVVFSGIYFAFGPLLIDVLTGVPEVRTLAREFLPWAAISPLISVWSFQLDGIFIGSTWTREMRNGMIVSLAVFGLCLIALTPTYANHGLWLAFMLFMAARAVTLGLQYPRLERAIGDL